MHVPVNGNGPLHLEGVCKRSRQVPFRHLAKGLHAVAKIQLLTWQRLTCQNIGAISDRANSPDAKRERGCDVLGNSTAPEGRFVDQIHPQRPHSHPAQQGAADARAPVTAQIAQALTNPMPRHRAAY